MKLKKYRIVTDNYNGFEVQEGFILLPFIWWELTGSNTHSTLKKAEEFARNNQKKVVKYLNF
jgi:hypothetical protein